MGILAAVAGTTALVFLIIIILQMRDNGRLKESLRKANCEKAQGAEHLDNSRQIRTQLKADLNTKKAALAAVEKQRDNWEQLYRTECKLRDGIRKQKLTYWKTQCNRARGQLGLVKLKGPKT